MAYSLEQIKNVLEKKNYEFFDGNLKYNLNIISVRTDNDVPDSFDDTIYLIYRDDDLKLHIENYPVTTDPGLHWLLNPIAGTKGTAILVPGQYRGSHTIRKHQGKYDAVCQAKPIKVWRDNNRDKVLDFNNETQQTGLFGINIHRSNPSTESTIVNKWSAGCTVFKRVDNFNSFMKLAYKSKAAFGNSFTYTLLEEKDFKGHTGTEKPTNDPVVEHKAKSDKEKKAEKEIKELNEKFMSILTSLEDKRLAEFLLTERLGLTNTVNNLLNDLSKLKDSPEKEALVEELEKEERLLGLALDWYKKQLRMTKEMPPTDKIIDFVRKKNEARHKRLASLNKKVALLEIAQNS